MVKTVMARIMNFALLSLLPILAGCNGGGGGGSSAGGISGLSSLGGGLTNIPTPDSLAAVTGGDALATLHNPEPATMLLLGGGIAAMAIVRSTKFHKR